MDTTPPSGGGSSRSSRLEGTKDFIVTHPVAKHLLERQGKTVPINDGRKIALVLFGGTMCGVRGGGALLALDELGLNHAFDKIFTVSAGFGNASYFLADQVNLGASIYYEEMTGGSLVKPRRFWKILDVDQLMDICKNKKPLKPERILEQKTELFVRLVNARTGKREYLEVHSFSPEEYFDLFRAVITAPRVLGGKKTYVHGTPYHDTPFWGPDALGHVSQAISSDATDILIIYNHLSHQKRHLTDTRVLEILPDKEWRLGRLDINPERVRQAAHLMKEKVIKTFR